MADTFTPHYNLTKPQVGGDPDTWGDLLNGNADIIDTAIFNAATAASGALLVDGSNAMLSALLLAPVTGSPTIVMRAAAAGSQRFIQAQTGSRGAPAS